MISTFNNIAFYASKNIQNVHGKTSDVCIEATKGLLEKLGWNEKDIRVLILVTRTPDFKYPSTSFYIQQALKMDRDCMVYDINQGINGFGSGLQIGASLLQPYGEGAKGIIMFGDSYSEVAKGCAIGMEVDKNAEESYFESCSNGMATIDKTDYAVEEINKYINHESDGHSPISKEGFQSTVKMIYK